MASFIKWKKDSEENHVYIPSNDYGKSEVLVAVVKLGYHINTSVTIKVTHFGWKNLYIVHIFDQNSGHKSPTDTSKLITVRTLEICNI